MKIHHLVIIWLCACANVAQALSLFPTVTSFDVAATTNREVARGMATEGTNFLVVFQGDNLYAGVAATNQLAAQLLATNGAPSGPRVDLALNGGVPVVAFGTSNYLMVWNEPDGSASHIHGQFLDRNGNKAGAKFVISSNAHAVEVGTIKFGLGQFWVTWAQTNVTNNARIVLQRLAQTGEPMGDLLPLGAGASTNQQFPTLSASVTNMLVAWVAQRADTNAWDVLGRLVESNGHASAEMLISQTPANEPYPIGAASDGTDHLVVWSREAGSNHLFYVECGSDENGLCWYFTNIVVPVVFGKVIGSGREEFQISRSQWGQISPVTAFDGTNYFVTWNDHRHSQIGAITDPPRWWIFEGAFTKREPFSQFISTTGSLVETEFRLVETPGRYSPISFGPSLAIAASAERTIMLRGVHSNVREDVQVVALSSHVITTPHLFVETTTNNLFRVTLNGLNTHAALYTSTNLVHWTLVPSARHLGERLWNGEYREFPTSSNRLFFRAAIGYEQCKSNLRRLNWAKQQLAIARESLPGDYLPINDVLSYFPQELRCPHGGHYSLGTVEDPTNCSVLGHTGP